MTTYLHTMVRITDAEKSGRFYEALGFQKGKESPIVRNGELEGLKPKLVLLMIGTNNGDPAPDVAAGIKTLLADIHERCPRTKFLLLGIVPRSEKPDGARAKNEEVNKRMSKFAMTVGRSVRSGTRSGPP